MSLMQDYGISNALENSNIQMARKWINLGPAGKQTYTCIYNFHHFSHRKSEMTRVDETFPHKRQGAICPT